MTAGGSAVASEDEELAAFLSETDAVAAPDAPAPVRARRTRGSQSATGAKGRGTGRHAGPAAAGAVPPAARGKSAADRKRQHKATGSQPAAAKRQRTDPAAADGGPAGSSAADGVPPSQSAEKQSHERITHPGVPKPRPAHNPFLDAAVSDDEQPLLRCVSVSLTWTGRSPVDG